MERLLAHQDDLSLEFEVSVRCPLKLYTLDSLLDYLLWCLCGLPLPVLNLFPKCLLDNFLTNMPLFLALFCLMLLAILGLDMMGAILLLSLPIGLVLNLADRKVLGRLDDMIYRLFNWGRCLL
jgi:hypothetical protein